MVVLPSTLRGTILSIAALGIVHWTAVLVPEVHLLDRLLWLAAAVLGMVVVPRAAASAIRVLGLKRPLWRSLALGGARLGVVLLAGGAVLEILGITLLSETLVNGVLFGLYFAVVFRTAVEVVAQTVDVFLNGRLAGRSRSLLRYRADLRVAVRRSATGLAFVSWLAGTLSAFLLLTPVMKTVGRLLSASVSVGAVRISAGDALVFAIAVWLSFAVSRLIRSVLEAELLSRITLPQGAPQALSTLTHWAVLLLGLVVALGLVGIDITSFALLAGALGVGIGFGLQNVVNNFVSGLILLFERPIRVGDKVQLGQLGGEVTAIGIRASTVRTWEGAEVVVPNGNLISNEIFNWTLSDSRRRLEIPVGVAYGTDPGRVLELLVEAAGTVPLALAEPAPYALFTGFGDSSLDFELRAWCLFDDSLSTQTALRVAIVRALAEAGIEIPFPQRDLHLRSVTDAAGERLSTQER
jgi:small-conductance mechanosensitive channel